MARFDTPDYMAHALTTRMSLADATAHATMQRDGSAEFGDADGAAFWSHVLDVLAFFGSVERRTARRTRAVA